MLINRPVISEYAEGAGQVLNWTKNYVFMSGALLATQTRNGNSETVQFDHPDQLGTRIITDPGTGTSFEQNSLPFGTSLDSETTGSINQRFTSYDRSATTGLDYAVNRFYDSAQGRFTTVDPIKMAATSTLSPQSLNLYAYTENDPVNKTDPSGLTGFPTLGGGGGSNPTINIGTWTVNVYAPPGNSIPSWLSNFLTGVLGNLFSSGNQWYPGMQVGPTVYFWQFNTAGITLSAPPPLPGAGTIKAVNNGGSSYKSDDSLNCPPAATQLSWGAQNAFDHYVQGSGRTVYIPLDEVQARFPLPTDFLQVAKLIKKGTGKKIFVNHQIYANSEAAQTGGWQAAVLGRITLNLSGRLSIDKFGVVQFIGTIGVLADIYDFDASKRGKVGEFSTWVGRQLPGKPYKIQIVGRYDVNFERSSNGKIEKNECK